MSKSDQFAEQRATALNLLKEGKTNVEVAKQLGIRPNVVGIWKHKAKNGTKAAKKVVGGYTRASKLPTASTAPSQTAFRLVEEEVKFWRAKAYDLAAAGAQQ